MSKSKEITVRELLEELKKGCKRILIQFEDFMDTPGSCLMLGILLLFILAIGDAITGEDRFDKCDKHTINIICKGGKNAKRR